MNHVDIAIATPLHRTFTYLSAAAVHPGQRVLVPFGTRKVVGVVLGPASSTALDPSIELKAIESIIDAQPVYSATVLDIARWLSNYYMHPLGEVLRTMLPASASKVVKETYVLSDAGLAARSDDQTAAGRILGAIFGKKKSSLSASLCKTKLARLHAAAEAGSEVHAVTLKKLQKAGLLTATRASSATARRQQPMIDAAVVAAATVAPPPLPPAATPEQAMVLAEILAAGLDAPAAGRVYLLHGVTGSGKTEVYLQLIAAALPLADGTGQALVLVPEISLTPQMTRVFSQRFPGLVAVVHSAMSDAERWTQLNRIRCGEAKILIGPRSAIFGPFQKLSLILVDEEHDHSYKQSTGLTYHGRDIAVLRGKLERATVVLGSATPSLESYQNARTGRYKLLTMSQRVSGRPLPSIEVLPMPKGPRQGTLITARGSGKGAVPLESQDQSVPLDPVVLAALTANLAAKRQAIVLVNRRGYAYYLLSVDSKKAVQCVSCSISMTLHARSTVLRCHYCDYAVRVDQILKERPDERFIAIGYGSQKAEDGLRSALPDARIVRLDSDAVSTQGMLPKTLNAFRQGEIDILVGTQILAKGHDFPNVTLIVILEVDQLLGLPDFRAGERTFQLIVQAAGRAGRAEHAGQVLIQTMREDHPVVNAAVHHDYQSFVERELLFRQQHAYPPFARMIAIEFNGPDQGRLDQLCRRIEDWIEQMAEIQPQRVRQVRLLGPAIPPIETIRGRHRRQLIFTSEHQEPLRALVAQFAATFQKQPGDVRMRIDVDPQSLI